MLERLIEGLRKNRIVQLLINLKELIALAGSYVVFVTAPFAGPALDVTYHVETIERPLRSLLAADSLRDQGVPTTSAALRLESMIRSPKLLTVKLNNRSSEPATNLEVRVIPAMNVAEVAINSTSAEVMRNAAAMTSYECCSEYTMTLPGLKTLPARSVTTIQVWGEFGERFFFASPVDVAATGRRPAVWEGGYLSGLDYFAGRHFGQFALLLGALLLLLGIYRIRGA